MAHPKSVRPPIAGASQTAAASQKAVEDQFPEASDFEQLYRKWYVEVCRWVRAVGGLDADVDDLAQDVFIVVRRKLHTFDGGNLPGWLYRITWRTVSQYRRRVWFSRFFLPSAYYFEQLVDDNANPGEVAESREASRLVQGVLSHLSDRQRAAFVLYEIEGYSGEEIAALEGVPVDTIYTRLHYARREFLKRLEKLNRTKQ